MDLTCPKCRGTMRSYERNGITVDQCEECRGIFLDRGELEKLVDAETKFHAPAPAAAPAPPAYGSPPRRDDDRNDRYDKDRYDRERERYEKDRYDRDDHDRDRYDKDRYDKDRYHGGYGKKKKRSLFEELFD